MLDANLADRKVVQYVMNRFGDGEEQAVML